MLLVVVCPSPRTVVENPWYQGRQVDKGAEQILPPTFLAIVSLFLWIAAEAEAKGLRCYLLALVGVFFSNGSAGGIL